MLVAEVNVAVSACLDKTSPDKVGKFSLSVLKFLFIHFELMGSSPALWGASNVFQIAPMVCENRAVLSVNLGLTCQGVKEVVCSRWDFDCTCFWRDRNYVWGSFLGMGRSFFWGHDCLHLNITEKFWKLSIIRKRSCGNFFDRTCVLELTVHPVFNVQVELRAGDGLTSGAGNFQWLTEVFLSDIWEHYWANIEGAFVVAFPGSFERADLTQFLVIILDSCAELLGEICPEKGVSM